MNDDYRNKRFAISLFIICVCGVLGILIDLDHVVIPIRQIIELLSGHMVTYASRPAHIPCVVVSGLVWFVANTLVLRLLCKYMGLRKKRI